MSYCNRNAKKVSRCDCVSIEDNNSTGKDSDDAWAYVACRMPCQSGWQIRRVLFWRRGVKSAILVGYGYAPGNPIDFFLAILLPNVLKGEFEVCAKKKNITMQEKQSKINGINSTRLAYFFLTIRLCSCFLYRCIRIFVVNMVGGIQLCAQLCCKLSYFLIKLYFFIYKFLLFMLTTVFLYFILLLFMQQ
jgi:hypothetical protein